MNQEIIQLIKKKIDRLFKWLFGEEEWEQEEKLGKLINWTLILLVGMIILLFIEPGLAETLIAVIFLMWGWRVVVATSGIHKIAELFHYNIVAFVIVFMLWIFLGYFAGMACSILGIIRYLQLKRK